MTFPEGALTVCLPVEWIYCNKKYIYFSNFHDFFYFGGAQPLIPPCLCWLFGNIDAFGILPWDGRHLATLVDIDIHGWQSHIHSCHFIEFCTLRLFEMRLRCIIGWYAAALLVDIIILKVGLHNDRECHELPVEFHGFLTDRHIDLNFPYILQFFLWKTVKNWAIYIPSKFWHDRQRIDVTVALLAGFVTKFRQFPIFTNP